MYKYDAKKISQECEKMKSLVRALVSSAGRHDEDRLTAHQTEVVSRMAITLKPMLTGKLHYEDEAYRTAFSKGQTYWFAPAVALFNALSDEISSDANPIGPNTLRLNVSPSWQYGIALLETPEFENILATATTGLALSSRDRI